jgi:hypothetical protein
MEKQLSNETLKTTINRRKAWLDLPEHEKYSACRTVAEKSFEYLPDGVENVEDLSGTMSYHLACYRNFTDITKIERAKKIAETEILNCSGSSTSRASKDGDCDGPAQKVKRTTTRLSYSLRDAGNEHMSSNVLAKCCLICKQSGPIYVYGTYTRLEILIN